MSSQYRVLVACLFFMLFGYTCVHAQITASQAATAIDSLLKILPGAKEDTNKAMLLNNLSFLYRKIDPDGGIMYGQEELELATKLDWMKGIGCANNDLGVNYEAEADYPKALEFFFKSLQVNQGLGNNNGIADNFGNIGVAYAGEKDFAGALKYYSKALTLFGELGDKNGMANALGNAGVVYTYQSNYPMALDYFSKAVSIYEEAGNKDAQAAAFGNMGLVYAGQNDYPRSLEYYLKALKNNEESGNKIAAAESLRSIAIEYKSEGDFSTAIDYENKALQANEELGDKIGVIKNLADIGNIYSAKGDYVPAYDSMFKAFKMAEDADNKYLEAMALGDIGLVYREQLSYTAALLCYFKAAMVDSGLADRFDQSDNLGSIGITYLDLSKETGIPDKTLPDSALHTGPYIPGTIPLGKSALLGRAIAYISRAIAIKKETRDMAGLQAMFQRLAQADSLRGDYKSALAAYMQYAAFKDSVDLETNRLRIANTQTELDIVNRNAQSKIDKLAGSKDKTELWLKIAGASAIVLFLLVIVFVVLFIGSRRKIKKRFSSE